MEGDRRPRGPVARATIRRSPPAPPRHPNPEAVGPPDSKPPAISHVARRRAPSVPAEPEAPESGLEEFDFLEPASTRAPAWTPPLPPPESTSTRRSPPPLPVPRVAPAAEEVATVPIPLPDVAVAVRPAATWKRISWKRATLVLSGVALLALTFRMGMLTRGRGGGDERHGESQTVTATTTGASPSNAAAESPRASAAPGPIPIVDVTALPRARLGTVIGSAGHRLWIDGKLADTWTAVVACGSHEVQVGSAGLPRTVKVPCGDEIAVSP